MAIAAGAVNYNLTDATKVGLSSAGPAGIPTSGILPWKVSTTWAAGAIVQNGAFIFKTTAGGAGASSGVGPTPISLTDNSCTWVLVGGCTPLTTQDASALHDVGYIAQGRDFGPNAYGWAEFEYVKFTGTVVAGDFVVLDRAAQTCVQASTSSAKGPIGIAMNSQVSGNCGWIMLRGVHDGANVASAVTAGTALGVSATAGRAAATSATNKIDGAFERNATSASNQGTVQMDWPAWTGNG